MKLTLLSTSDTHGYIMPTTFGSRKFNQTMGLAKAAAVIKKESQENNHVLKFELGDFIQGSPLSYYIAKNDNHDVNELIELANKIAYDATTIGNHEFNYGLEYLKKAITLANYPVLSANILDKKTKKPAFGQPYRIFEQEDLKIAVLGLTTQYIPHWEQPEHIQDLEFESIVKTAKEYVPMLRKQADIVIVLYHGGFECDLVTGEPTEELTGENEGYKLLKEVSGIDALLTGHQHRSIATKVHGVPVTQPGYRGQYVGKIVLEIEDKQVISSQAELIDVTDFQPSREIVELCSDLSSEVEDWLDQPIGKVVEGDMTISNPHEARIKEHPYIELIQKVQMEATGVDISGTALFNNEGKGFNKTISMRDIVTNYIYPNTLAVLKVNGATLKEALEQSASFFVLDNGEIKVNPKFIEPKPQYYNYDMYEGIDYTIDLRKPIGERITELKYHDLDVTNDMELEIVTNQYRAVGGGNYRMFDASKIVKEVQIDMTELIADYLIKHPKITATTNNNFKIIY